MYVESSRGPTNNNTPILKPEIVAPAVGIQTLSFVANNTMDPRNGTSYAVPQVSATAALLLQAKPDMTPVEVKAAILLGANWTGPIPCTSEQYEKNDTSSGCSFARQPGTLDEGNNAASLEILNNVGFGILNVNQTLEYTSQNAGRHVLGDHLNSDSDRRMYNFTVTDTSEPVKVIVTWMAYPHGSIIDQESRSSPVNVADLDFEVACPGVAKYANSTHQTNEFMVFMPAQSGTCVVTVNGTGIGDINKPVQNYAIASTHQLIPHSSDNRHPVALPRTVIIDPNRNDPAMVWLYGIDHDGDSLSFSVSSDPVNGAISVAEFITKTASRALYTPDTGFVSDAFEVTPHDGSITGTPATMTLVAESLPPSARSVNSSLDGIRWQDVLRVETGSVIGKHSQTFLGPSHPVHAIHVGSVNLEGVDLRLVTTSGEYTVAIPPSGTRMIELASPLSVTSVTLSADGMDEEAIPGRDDIRMSVGYTTCSIPDTIGNTTCPADGTYHTMFRPGIAIADNTDSQDASGTIMVPANVTINTLSASVDITHTHIGDIRVVLTAPNGTEAILHDRTGGSAADIVHTYNSSSHGALRSLTNSTTAGIWTLSVGDYARGDVGTLNSWSLAIDYSQMPPDPPPMSQPANTTLLSDDFADLTLLANWQETGEPDWESDVSPSNGVPAVPGHASGNRVLHADNCDTSCTLTLKTPIDLTAGYSSASLSFWRFVDSGHDSDEYLKVEAYDGSTWSTIYHWSDSLGQPRRRRRHVAPGDVRPCAVPGSERLQDQVRHAAEQHWRGRAAGRHHDNGGARNGTAARKHHAAL